MPKQLKEYPELLIGRMPEGTIARVDRIITPPESRSSFIRESVLKTLEEREAE